MKRMGFRKEGFGPLVKDHHRDGCIIFIARLDFLSTRKEFLDLHGESKRSLNLISDAIFLTKESSL